MCGMFFSCSQVGHQPPSIALLDDLNRRGPDGADLISPTVTLETTASRKSCLKVQKKNYFLTFLSTVLSLRGSSTIKQPLRDPESGSLLCWNGEAWKIGGQPIQGNDAVYVFNVFLNATKSPSKNPDDTLALRNHSLQGVIDMLSTITGPYAFVFYDAQYHRVFYGRDALGRRSLLLKRSSATSMVLSSTSDRTETEDWMEVEADGIYAFDLNADADLSDDDGRVVHIPWAVDRSTSVLPHSMVPQLPILLWYLGN